MSKAEYIDKSIDSINVELKLLGIGIPVSGELFQTSSSQFSQIATAQGAAGPGANWSGSAADKYSDRNLFLQDCEKIVADVDYITGTLVSDQAKAVKDARGSLEHQISYLKKMRPIAVDLWHIPFVGHALSKLFQIPVCSNAMQHVASATTKLATITAQNTTKLLQLIAQILELLLKLPADIVKDLIADLESELAQIIAQLQYDITHIIPEVAHEISHVISDLKYDVTHIIPGLESELSHLPHPSGSSRMSSLTHLSRSTQTSNTTALSNSASVSGSTSLSDSSSHASPLSGLTHAPGGAGLQTSNPAGASVGQTPRLTAETRPISNPGGQSSNRARILDSQVDENTHAPPGSMPSPALGRLAKDAEAQKGAASGTAAAERAPVSTDAASEQPRQRHVL
ncbi:EspA/EspE family type VII secretion system effector [Mycobacterium decipiens]|uniref:ESX-1 secretion-associated protein EspA/EspE-like domain-containing protein n=1 Tax=Mycobacterium decipiens TaxID=1430326 RepID=A0A1X2LZT5_9MYCO|nr:EspA/EspE family type VII secretion system effector [Mycobacterium decipiens]OSC42885.1 hypothetical protein B8W66_00205 [Mycobacterium decipiens]